MTPNEITTLSPDSDNVKPAEGTVTPEAQQPAVTDKVEAVILPHDPYYVSKREAYEASLRQEMRKEMSNKTSREARVGGQKIDPIIRNSTAYHGKR